MENVSEKLLISMLAHHYDATKIIGEKVRGLQVATSYLEGEELLDANNIIQEVVDELSKHQQSLLRDILLMSGEKIRLFSGEPPVQNPSGS
jgi:hypothetical protein